MIYMLVRKLRDIPGLWTMKNHGGNSMHQQGAIASPGQTGTQPDALDDMRRAFETRSEAQQLAATQCSRRNTRLTLISTGLAAAGGTGAFASLGRSDDELLVFIAASLSIAAAVINEAASRLAYSNRVAEHRKGAATAGAQARRILFAQGNPVGPDIAERRYHDFLRELQSFDTETDPAPDNLYKEAEGKIKKRRLAAPAPHLIEGPTRRPLWELFVAVPAAFLAGALVGWRAIRRPV
jgi:hypothetical protein